MNIDYLHQTTQLDLDWWNVPYQVHSNGKNYSAVRSLHQSIGFASGRVGMRYPQPWFPLWDGPSRCSFRTTTNYRLCLSSRAGCRFGRSGSSGFVGGFLRLRWCGFDRRNRIRTARTLRKEWRFSPGYDLLIEARNIYISLHITYIFRYIIFQTIILLLRPYD